MGAWAFILCTGHRWCKTKEQQPWNNTKQIFPGQKTRKSFALRHLCLLHEVLSGIWSPLISGQIVNSFGQGKCTISKTIPLATILNKLMHVENWETMTCMWTIHTNSLLHAWVFVSHACTQINVNTFINDLVLFTGILQC